MQEWVSGNIFIRAHLLSETGGEFDGRAFNYDHTIIVFSGAIRVEATLPDGETVNRDFYAPSHFLMKAGVGHQITALLPDTVFWDVFSHRDAQGEVVQEPTGLYDAYV